MEVGGHVERKTEDVVVMRTWKMEVGGHVERKTEDVVVMRTWKIEVGGHRKIGRPQLRWSDVIQKETKETEKNHKI